MPETHADSLTTAAAAPPAEKYTLFGKYEVGRLLGCGGFANVYHARDVRTGHSVAIKAIIKSKLEKNKIASHITREISIMRKLRHPHIITLYEVLATKNKIYVVMEFAKGGEVFAKVVKGRFSEDLARRYFQQLISAVGYCHSRGVYHRDLKPENLLLDENWNLKVTDFGLSAVKEQNNDTDGMLHTRCGTPAYVAPEVLVKKGYFGSKVDVWSCGVILFVLTAGYLPFNDTNLMNLYRKIYKGEFRCPRWMSMELKHLLNRLLDVNPDTRITIEEILVDPWFKKGYKEISFMSYNDHSVNIEGESLRYLNAFDLISFSPGFNLSGLFMEGSSKKGEISCCETFLSAEEAEKVVECVERAAREVDVPRVEVERVKGGMGVRVEGQNGNFGLVVEVHRLTEELVVVEVRKREKDLEPSHAFWKEKLRPKISNLIYKPGRVVGSSSSLPGPSNRTGDV